MALDTLKKLEENQQKLASFLPETMQNLKMVRASVLKDGALTTREKTLIGLGIAVSKQCSYCIIRYVKTAIDLDIKLEEIMEACGVSMLMNGGPGVAYSTFVLDTYEEIKKSM